MLCRLRIKNNLCATCIKFPFLPIFCPRCIYIHWWDGCVPWHIQCWETFPYVNILDHLLLHTRPMFFSCFDACMLNVCVCVCKLKPCETKNLNCFLSSNFLQIPFLPTTNIAWHVLVIINVLDSRYNSEHRLVRHVMSTLLSSDWLIKGSSLFLLVHPASILL